MSDRPDHLGEESHDEIVAGEYVLGVLSVEDRRSVEARMAADPDFAMRVRRWQDNLESFDEAYVDQMPPPDAFAAIEHRLFGPAEQPASLFSRIWASVFFWRATTLASIITAFGMAVSVLVLDGNPQAGAPLVAELAGEGATLKLLAAYDAASGRLRLTPVAGDKVQPKSLELWMIEGDGPALSLGVISQDGNGDLLVPADLRGRITTGTTLAVSLEPLGGSPTGTATGPVLAVGKIGTR